ncbi:MAG: epmB [Gammaproteobacteria bacterium]|jgi:EF-P beta-lysylation protein EpmB|nr:epmB [Gammaproteobacteria bacterium]
MKKKLSWQQALQQCVTSLDELASLIPAVTQLISTAAQSSFPFKASRRYLAKINPHDATDPLLLQILPQAIEMQHHSAFSPDPLQEHRYNSLPGLIHKYASRVLITLVGSCAIHCRYCFRRHFAYEDNRPGTQGLEAIYEYIRAHPEVNEVILSGGDPLLANDAVLQSLTQALSKIPHLKRVRIHTRLITTIPERITPELIHALTHTRLKSILVAHCNHPRELDDDIAAACNTLVQNNITVLNQGIFLAGVNDNAETLIALSEKLFSCHILPYYLHSLDAVTGSAHFDLPLERQRALYTTMQEQLPGFLVPKWVKEVPGEKHKVRMG